MITTVTPKQAQKWLAAGEATLIDVRNPDEFAAEHIAGALSIPLSVLPQTLATLPLPAKRKVLFQCNGGKRGGQACALVQTLKGFPHKAHNLEGGLIGWKSAALPVVSTPAGISIFRQVQIIVGSLVALLVATGFLLHLAPAFAVAGLLGAALAISGLTGWCGMALLLAKMPWNRS